MKDRTQRISEKQAGGQRLVVRARAAYQNETMREEVSVIRPAVVLEELHPRIIMLCCSHDHGSCVRIIDGAAVAESRDAQYRRP